MSPEAGENPEASPAVQPDPSRPPDPDWRERIELARRVRRETLEARKTRQSSLEVVSRVPLQAGFLLSE